MEMSKHFNSFCSAVLTILMVGTVVVIPAFFGFNAYLHVAYNVPMIVISANNFSTCISVFVVGVITFSAYMFMSLNNREDDE